VEYKKVAGKLLADKRSNSKNYLETCLLMEFNASEDSETIWEIK